jgi:hypothetical protein
MKLGVSTRALARCFRPLCTSSSAARPSFSAAAGSQSLTKLQSGCAPPTIRGMHPAACGTAQLPSPHSFKLHIQTDMWSCGWAPADLQGFQAADLRGCCSLEACFGCEGDGYR